MIIHCTNNSLLRLIAFITLPLTVTLTFTESLTLCTEVVAQHCTKDKIFLWCQFIKGTGDNEANRIETLLTTNIEV